MKHSKQFMNKKADQAEALLNEYTSILVRDFTKLGDYSRAKTLLSQMAEIFKEVGGKENQAMAIQLLEERKKIDELLDESLRAYGVEI